jgi:hypothetical protein
MTLQQRLSYKIYFLVNIIQFKDKVICDDQDGNWRLLCMEDAKEIIGIK